MRTFNTCLLRELVNKELIDQGLEPTVHCCSAGLGRYVFNYRKLNQVKVDFIYDSKAEQPYICRILGGNIITSKNDYDLEELAFNIAVHLATMF